MNGVSFDLGLGAKETIETELRIYEKPREGDRITVHIPAGLKGETRENAIRDEMLKAITNKLHFSFIYV